MNFRSFSHAVIVVPVGIAVDRMKNVNESNYGDEGCHKEFSVRYNDSEEKY